LVDPDKVNIGYIESIFSDNNIDINYILIGGSILLGGTIEKTIQIIRTYTSLPIFLFPGNHSQLSPLADGILLLSLISGRNADLLIGQHVYSSFALAQSKISILPTGYILIDGGNTTTVQYMSNTLPIPPHKPELAAATALAGVQLGLQNIYLEAGSGALKPVPNSVISSVRKAVDVPIWVGGGINTSEKAATALLAGADILVIGTAAEKNSNILTSITDIVRNINHNL
jgi:putative glycerol-1-phosphate prenyltransferase